MKQLFFYLPKEMIKDRCTFDYNFNDTTIRPAVLKEHSEIILPNWLNSKYLECASNNDIPINIPDYAIDIRN